MIVIGAGRVGTALAGRSQAVGIDVALVHRDHGWAALDGPPGDPVLLAVRNDDLREVVARVPAHRRDDLVFVQNGMIRTFLQEKGLDRATRGLLYFAVARKGDAIVAGGQNPFCGPHSGAMTRWFVQLGLEARALDWAGFSYFELEKAIWLSALGLLCARERLTVGEVVDQHPHDLERLVDELRQVGRAAIGVDVPLPYLLARVVAYSRQIAFFRASVKEWDWRNGWFADQAVRFGVDTPLHDALIRATRTSGGD